MTIALQGAWTVKVKGKSAAFPQRFIVAGATTGNGTYVAAAARTHVAFSRLLKKAVL